MPGVLILEALAQTGGVALLSEKENQGRIALFGGVRKARFRAMVVPGDVLELECRLTARRGPVGVGEASARVNGKTACTAELTFALQKP
jgi:3-hydroxyacyl-[acyl-carrier-protein] dehydratase